MAVECHSVTHGALQVVLMPFHSSFLMDERKFRMDKHPAGMDEWGRDCGDKQMFCLMWDFMFDPSRAMDRKTCLVRQAVSCNRQKILKPPPEFLILTWAEESQELQCYLDYFKTDYLKKIMETSLLTCSILKLAKYRNWTSEQKINIFGFFKTSAETCFLSQKTCGRE